MDIMYNEFWYCFIIIMLFGATVGSFLNVCIYRIPQNISIVFPGSHCTTCNRKLRVWELMPILSYLILRGRCSQCKTKFSAQYCLVELFTALLAGLIFWQYGLVLTSLFVFIFSAFLIVIAVIDFHQQLIFDNILIIMFLLGIGNYFWGSASVLSFYDTIIGFFLGGGFFLILALLSNGGMGGGDIKLMAVLGFWLGWKLLIVAALIAFVVGAFAGVLLMIICKKGRKELLPFAPFLALGAIIAILFGEKIIAYYLSVM